MAIQFIRGDRLDLSCHRDKFRVRFVKKIMLQSTPKAALASPRVLSIHLSELLLRARNGSEASVGRKSCEGYETSASRLLLSPARNQESAASFPNRDTAQRMT